ncbi:protein MIZU-KUSSEI 1-like [Cucurbita pepo subsp. pepo]|uniref:protein MIZU-KUSSEI 1-like n=1 Tax=Cucurbita pepo subsp. pepo TaxID=3664 RepID=UPI000C9D6F11|nr:protein MIZU-KUSSEI 1-like [Cucurbita pepo subsp. pepo]
MGDPKSTAALPELQSPPKSSAPPQPPPLPPQPSLTSSSSLVPPSKRKKNKTKVFRVFRSVFRSFPIITPAACKIPSLPSGISETLLTQSGSRVTGTLFGYRKGRVSLSIQETPRSFPSIVIELAMQTNVLQKEMSSGMVRIALECEKRTDKADKTKLMEEPLWTMFCNGKKNGYGVKREASDDDLKVMELLRAVSMGAGVLPGNSDVDGPDGEQAYMRAHFERVVGSRDSETFYMLSPEENSGPELSIFFVRI